jgi:hypothetical protein
VTLLYTAKNEVHNLAIVLRDYLHKKLKGGKIKQPFAAQGV